MLISRVEKGQGEKSVNKPCGEEKVRRGSVNKLGGKDKMRRGSVNKPGGKKDKVRKVLISRVGRRTR